MFRLTGQSEEKAFLDQVMERSGQNLLKCLQCGKCSGGCPIVSTAVGGPRRLIARILSGMRDESLRDPTWWFCVSCGTCATRCPVEINLYAVATALGEIGTESGVRASEPDIHLFEDLFLKSVEKNGRVQEMKTVMTYKLRSGHPFQDALLGLRMGLKGIITPSAMIQPAKKDQKVSRIFEKIRQRPPKKALES